MSSAKEEERNEKIIRGLMKLPPNRRCINCGSMGPQYVCTNFWTFICYACSGIHREFTHRVKSVSLAKFSSLEIEALQRGGNQRAREIYLQDWDMQHDRLPDSSNPVKIREFIRSVYMDKKYAGGRSSDKPPRNSQGMKNHGEEHRRASSYHSYSQSPPNEYQYEERLYGKQTGMLTRKPGSDRGHYEGKLSSLIYSPSQETSQMHDDKFAIETSGPRFSDYSRSSASDVQNCDGHSSNSQKETGYRSPPAQQATENFVKEVKRQTLATYFETDTEKGTDQIQHLKRTASSGSFGSSESNSMSSKSFNADSSIGDVGGKGQLPRDQCRDSSFLLPLAQSTSVMHNQNPFGFPSQKNSTDFSTQFTGFELAPLSNTSYEKIAPVTFAENGGWATFDTPHFASSPVKTDVAAFAAKSSGAEIPNAAFNAILSVKELPCTKNSVANQNLKLTSDQLFVASVETDGPSVPPNVRLWNPFSDSAEDASQASLGNLPSEAKSHAPFCSPPESTDSNMSSKFLEDFTKIRFQEMTSSEGIPLANIYHVDGALGTCPSPVLLTTGGQIIERKSTNPFDLPYDFELESSNEFLDMNPLDAALPNLQVTISQPSGSFPSWFTQKSASSYNPFGPSGDSACITGQPSDPHFPILSSQAPIASMRGNPFA